MRTLTKQASWGPRKVILPLRFRFSEPIIDKLDRVVKLVQRLAGPATHLFDLRVALRSADGAELQPLLSKLQGYSMLTTLRLDCGVLEDWSFVANFPDCITNIHLSALSAVSRARSWQDQQVIKSLDCFNRIHKLKELQLWFRGSRLVVSGSPDLPCLEELFLTNTYGVRTDDLCLDKLPLLCTVVTHCMLVDDSFERDWTWLDRCDVQTPSGWEHTYQLQIDDLSI